MRNRGFTLTELLVTLAIISVLMAIVIPTAKLFQAEARSVSCTNNMRQIWVCVDMYRQSNRDYLPMCEFVPVATADGPQGGLPETLKGFVEKDCECWRCAADFDEEGSLSTGTSYMYLPGLIRYTPQIQIAVQQAMAPFIMNPSMSQAVKDKLQRDAESKLVTRFYENSIDFAVITDSQDRHPIGDRNPKNAVYFDGRTGHFVITDDMEVAE
ncbi:MAG: type II secretion system protein [Phycisphaerae bacterium]|nr:type II secretion system protein [Phycisphaerae bacterium]